MATPEIQRVLQRLSSDVSRYFPDHAAPPRIGAVALACRPLSDLARVALRFGDTATAVYVKVHKKANAPIDRVRSKAGLEFETLAFLHERFRGIRGCAVVRPIAYFPEEMAVVTEAAAGENLHHLIKAETPAWRSQATGEGLSRYGRASGVWLRHFQRLTAQPRRERLNIPDALGWVRKDLEVCVEMGLAKAEARRLLAFCELELRRVEGHEFPVVGVHPDFQPDNILVSPTTVTVLDFTSFQYGGPYLDAARFLATLEAFRRNPFYGRGICSLMTAFLEGYGPPDEETHPVLLTQVVRQLVKLTRSVRSWRHPFPINRLVERRAVSFLADWQSRLQRIQATLKMVAA